MKIIRKIQIVVIAVIILVAIALIPKQKQGKPSGEKEIYSVKTEKITRQDLQEYLLMNGNVKADNTISVYPDIGGKLIEVPVTLGTYVKRGQTIAEVDPSTPGTIYTKSPVVAPIEGYITSLPLTQGTTVSTSTAIARIGNIKKLQIEAQVPERDIGVLRNGLTADVTLEAYKDEIFPAHIFRISPIVDETSRTKEIYYLFDTTDQRINAGMYVRLKLNTIMHKNVVVVPVDAIVTEGSKTYVYVLNSNQTVSKTEIETGITVDGKTEVRTGLSEGNQIVVNGIQALNDGASVHDIGGN